MVMSKPGAKIMSFKCHFPLKETSIPWVSDWLQRGIEKIQDKPRILYFLKHPESKELFKE